MGIFEDEIEVDKRLETFTSWVEEVEEMEEVEEVEAVEAEELAEDLRSLMADLEKI